MAGMKTNTPRARVPGDWIARALVLVGAATLSLSLDGCAAGSTYAELRTVSAPPPSHPSGGAMAEQQAVATVQAMPASATETAGNEGASLPVHAVPAHGRARSIVLTLPPLATLFLLPGDGG